MSAVEELGPVSRLSQTLHHHELRGIGLSDWQQRSDVS